MDGTQSLSKLPNHTGRPFPLGGLFFRHGRHAHGACGCRPAVRNVGTCTWTPRRRCDRARLSVVMHWQAPSPDGRMGRVSRLIHFACHLIRVACTIRHAMTKRAALRLASYFRSLGHRTKVRRHRSPAGAFYSLQVAPQRRTARRVG